MQQLHIRLYSDAAFAINEDLWSLLRYIVLLADDSDVCYVI